MIQKSVADSRRYIEITSGNIRNSHVYITGHHDFFPKDAFGASNAKSGLGQPVRIELMGLGTRIQTDIPRDTQTGKPRRQFRARHWVKAFFESNSVAPGDTLCLERTGRRNYRLSVAARASSELEMTFIEFFAGIGLVRLGLEATGWKIAYANDIDPQKFDMYRTHFHDADQHFVLADIHHLDAQKIPSATLATASFPCTDLSLAGGRRGLEAGQSSAFFGFMDILNRMGNRRPPLVLLENVPGFLTSHQGRDFHQAMRGLNELGYSVDPLILDARWFVPQSRPRLFVVASQWELAGPSTEMSDLLSSRIRPPLITRFINSYPDINWSRRSLPDPPDASAKTLTDILEDLPDDAPEWWNEERAQYLYDQMSPRHRKIAMDWMSRRKWSYGTVFRRVRRQPDGHKRSMGELRSDGLAGCLRTPKGGSGRQILFKAGYGKFAARLLTPRECARLMGADGFAVRAPLNQALFGFGDAVCVPAISWIAEHYLTPIVRETYSAGK